MSVGLNTDVGVWQALDFSVELPCEHSRHLTEHPVEAGAAWVQHSVCPRL